MLVNMGAAIITAALTALVESPLELYRHNSQAGHIQGNFLTAMLQVCLGEGGRLTARSGVGNVLAVVAPQMWLCIDRCGLWRTG
jgi:hypothetical protein